MIPKLLTIKGLYSYKTEQIINFETLTSGNLFGIFGNVGSGKSTILEAIMLALYGEVERIGKAGRSYNIMNLRSDDMYIVFDFEVEGKLYRSKVTARRSNKRFNEVSLKPPVFFEEIEGNFQPINITSAEVLIKLKPEDFKKTIIIPQGTFQDFLQLGDTERTRMMRELFGLERYELEENVKILQRRNDKNTEALKGQLVQIGDILEEDIDTKKSQLTDLQENIKNQQVELQAKRDTENELKQVKTDWNNWLLLKHKWDSLILQEDQILSLEKQIENYETAVLTFKNPLEIRRKLENDIKKNKTDIAKNKQKHLLNQDLFAKLNQEYQILTPQYQQREHLKRQAEEARKIVKIQQNQIEISSFQTRLSKGLQLLEEKKAIVENLKLAAIDVEKQRDILRLNQPDLAQLNALKNWFSISNNIQQEITRLQNEKKTLTDKLAGIDKTKMNIIWNDLPYFDINLTNMAKISETITLLKEKIGGVNKIIDNVHHEQLHLKAAEKLESLATALSEGDSCPLCGSTHHPSVMQIGEVRTALKKADAQLIRLKKDIKTLENIEKQLITLNINFNNETESLNIVLTKIEFEKQKYETHLQKFVWTNYSPTDANAVEIALKSAAEIDLKIKTLENSHRKINTEQAQTVSDIDKYQNGAKGINDIQKDLAASQSAIHVLKLQIQILNFDEWIQKKEKEINSHIQELENQYITIDKNFQELEKKRQTCQAEGQILRGGYETLTETETVLDADYNAVKADLATKLSHSTFENLEVIEKILLTSLDIQSERKKIETFKNQKLVIHSHLTELNEKLANKEYDAQKHNVLTNEIQSFEKDIEQKNQTIGELKRDIIDMNHRLEERHKVLQNLAALDIRTENLKILRGLFQHSRFVNYASSVFLQSIISLANERFAKLTKQQLLLEITENNSFIVRDILNNGKLRDVRTLSGGQTFQAALSLALALSDHIQSRNTTRQNFFFLDEGFGSLDRESLQTVFETLKALRRENRIVGIISHVEDMRLEIERYLLVNLHEETGSHVELVVG